MGSTSAGDSSLGMREDSIVLQKSSAAVVTSESTLIDRVEVLSRSERHAEAFSFDIIACRAGVSGR